MASGQLHARHWIGGEWLDAATLLDNIDPATGEKIGTYTDAGAPNMKRFGGELGGKTPVLLFDDADLEKALPAVQKALTTFAGQFCMTGSRLLVQRPILDIVRQRLATRRAPRRRSSVS